jgi:hypothetical protein
MHLYRVIGQVHDGQQAREEAAACAEEFDAA